MSHPELAIPASQESHFSCSMTAVLLARVRDHGGDEAISRLLGLAGSRRTPAYLADIGNWISFDEAIGLWRAGARVTHHPAFARAVGEDAVRRLGGSPVATLLRSLGSPQAVYEQVATGATKYSLAAILEAVESGAGHAVIRAVPAPGFPRAREHCEWTTGLLSQPPILFGLPAATVVHERCAAYGAPACVYHVSWPVPGAGADLVGPEAALRAQLEAMRLRLDSMFQTASDLISSGDVDEVLARIADRAAMEVRAPRHLLAVRLTEEGPLHLHHRGFAPDAAAACAHALESSRADALPGSWLAVPVASNRRRYGSLLATHAAGGSFFPQERELLQVYARYAASALDGAAALREAERRYAQSSALLGLARELAVAGTSAEIAGRLADAVGLVVDCDRVAVHLWDAGTRRLRVQACAPPEPELDQADASWAPERGGVIERLLRDPGRDPVLVDSRTEAIGARLAAAGQVATLLVPLAIPGRLLGLLAVSVRDRPERLRLSDDLLDRLSGVAAQATTALQNGRLVDAITHHALHDQLTGLPNRRRLTAELRAALDRARAVDERGALLYVDLDDFKPVNDALGHDAGDELLVEVARRLAACTRATDLVARIGGDEFAVLLMGAEEDEIDRVCERIAASFREPFRVAGRRVSLGVSIGRGRYPFEESDPDGLLRRADREMFAVKRANRGAPRAPRRQAPGDPYTRPRPTRSQARAGDGDLRREL